MRYYDPDQDDPVDGAAFTAEVLALLRDLTYRDSNDQEVRLSADGLAGLSGLLNMASLCMRDIAQQINENNPNS